MPGREKGKRTRASSLPKTRDPERTKQRIFQAAQTLFAQRGYSGVTIHDIAERAGVNRRMVYVYFESKLSLYGKVADEAFSVIWGRALDVLAESIRHKAGVEAYLDMVSAYFDALDEHPEYVRMLAWEMAARWERLNATDSPTLAVVAQRTAAILREGIEAGILWEDADYRLVDMLVSPLPLFYFLILPRHEHFSGQFVRESGKAYVMKMIKRTLFKPTPVRPHDSGYDGASEWPLIDEATLIF